MSAVIAIQSPPVPRVYVPLRSALVLVFAALAAAGAAQAQPVATAAARGDELTTAQQIDAWTHDDAPPTRPRPAPSGARQPGPADSPWADGLAPVLPFVPYDAPPIARTMVDGRIHGEVGAEGGNRGYGGYAVASGPLGDHGAVQVGVSDFHGTGGPRWSGWNGDHRSLNIVAAFDFSHDRKAAAPAEGATPEN